MKRVNLSVTARAEQAVLDRLVRLVPGFIGPDFLTVFAMAAALGIGASYFYANQNKWLYLVAAALYAAHWLGDSLDGKLARFRRKQRPNYGHYVDHVLDSLSVAIVLGGLTASAITFTAAWFWVATGFLLLMIHAYLKASVTGRFELSVGPIGPTEARIIGAGLSIMLFYTGNPVLLSKPIPFSLLDIIGTAAAIAMWALLAFSILKTAVMLDREDRKAWKKARA